MLDAIKNNDLIKYRRLYELDSIQGGFLLHCLIAKNESGQTCFKYAKEPKSNEIISYLKSKVE